jgi:hypothetical protein
MMKASILPLRTPNQPLDLADVMVRKDMCSHKSTMRDWSTNVGHLLSLILKTRDLDILLKPVDRYENLVVLMIGVVNRWNLVDHTTFVTTMIAAQRSRGSGQREAHIMMIVVDFRIRNLNHAELVVVMVLATRVMVVVRLMKIVIIKSNHARHNGCLVVMPVIILQNQADFPHDDILITILTADHVILKTALTAN